MTQRKAGFVASAFLFASFIMCLPHSVWADVGPATAGKSQTAPSPRKEATRLTSAPETEASNDSYGSTPWFDMDQVRKSLTYDGIKVRPRYRQEYEFDSNVFRDSKDPKSDSIFREIPGVLVVVPFQDHYVKADYEARLNQFVKFPGENSEDQYFQSEGMLNFTNMYLRAKEDLSHTSERSGTTFTERIPRFENKVDATGGYQWNHFLWEAGYTNFIRNFTTTRETALDYHYNRFHTRGYMDLTEKTKLFVDYVLTDYEYPNDVRRDGVANEISGGFKGYFLPKTSFFSRFGYEHIGYETSVRSDANNFIAEIGAHYDPLAGTSIDVGWTRSLEQATFAGNNDFRQDELFAKVRQKFTEKVWGESKVAYSNQDYRQKVEPGSAGTFTGKRDDDLFTFDVKLGYDFTDWMSADIRYQYNRRNSNASIFDYTENLMTCGLGLQV